LKFSLGILALFPALQRLEGGEKGKTSGLFSNDLGFFHPPSDANFELRSNAFST
jgi:hypothetical protein